MAQQKRSVLDVDWSKHPGTVESFVPVWGSAREAAADWHDGDYAGAVGNGLLAATDVIPAGLLGKVGGKVAIKTAQQLGKNQGVKKALVKGLAPVAHLNDSATWGSMRKVMTRDGRKPHGMHGHHWLIPQNGWGKAVPDRVKNQPWNIKVLDPETHARLSHAYKGNPQYDPVRRIFYGSPDWAKATTVSAAGHSMPRDNQRQKGGR